MKSLVLIIASSAFMLGSGHVQASHIVINESTISGGDFANTLADATILSAGADGVTGRFAADDVVDAFVFNGLAAGVQTFEYSISTDISSDIFDNFTFEIAEDGSSSLINILSGTSDGTRYNGTFSTSVGFSGALTGIFSAAGINTEVNYTLLKVATVPVPAAVWLFVSGFGLLGAVGVKRKRCG